MKKILIVILFSASLFSDEKKYFNVDGKNILDQDGKIILLRGINLGNWLNPEGYMFHFHNASSFRLIDNVIKDLVGVSEANNFWKSFRDNYITKEDISFIKKIGFNHIRVPFNFKLFFDENNPENFYDEGFKRLDDVISWCRDENLFVVLDLHAAPGGQTGDNIDDSWGYPYLFEDENAIEQTVLLWKNIAERYKNEKIIIGYDLLNEPIAHFFENKEELNLKLEPLYKKITSEIRSVDTNHIIFLGGAQWNTNFNVFGKPFDKKLVYTFHKYWMPPVENEILDFLKFRDKYNVPLYLGESGENEDAWINDFRILLEKNSIGWCFWPYKKMESTRGVAQFPKTKEWDEIIKYSQSIRNNFEEVRKNKPNNKIVKKALNDLIENIKFKNCQINSGYLNALGFKHKSQSK